MANCVGFRNYRYFCLTCIYLVVGAAFVVGTMTAYLDVPSQFFQGGSVRAQLPPHIMFAFVLCAAAGPSVSILAGWHIVLVLTGQSTIEFLERHIDHHTRRSTVSPSFWAVQTVWWKYWCCRGRRRPLPVHIYDLGWTRNWDQVFGPSRVPLIGWALPSVAPPQGDGMVWDTCSSLVSVSV